LDRVGPQCVDGFGILFAQFGQILEVIELAE
jgi:hypothetical protein